MVLLILRLTGLEALSGGIAGEVDDLEEHKNNIAAGVDNLAEFAEQNAESGRITSENMKNLENVMVSCKSSTDRIC